MFCFTALMHGPMLPVASSRNTMSAMPFTFGSWLTGGSLSGGNCRIIPDRTPTGKEGSALRRYWIRRKLSRILVLCEPTLVAGCRCSTTRGRTGDTHAQVGEHPGGERGGTDPQRRRDREDPRPGLVGGREEGRVQVRRQGRLLRDRLAPAGACRVRVPAPQLLQAGAGRLHRYRPPACGVP